MVKPDEELPTHIMRPGF